MFSTNKRYAFIFLATTLGISAQQLTPAERLGYPKDAKLLIIHADDLGVSHSENSASISALEQGPVNSASIMVPCPWFPEIAAYARANKQMDFGLHLTLTSEWKHYKWGPVTSRDSVSSLVNEDGYFFSAVDSLVRQGKATEVEVELRNQVRKAYSEGIDVTHLDAHMGAAVSNPEYAAAYMRVGMEFGLPVLLDPRIHAIDHPEIKDMLGENTVVLDQIFIATPDSYQKEGMTAFYSSVLRNLPVGLNCLLIHLAYDNEEMKAVTIDHPDYGSGWRQEDYDFFTSSECRKILEEEKIIVVSWRELRDSITRSDD
jgi:chitin disaccharide deacetylase